jgi:hypothetical protein
MLLLPSGAFIELYEKKLSFCPYLGRLSVINFVITRKRFFCPAKGRKVKVDFLAQMGKSGNLFGVKSCSAFKEGEEIDCNKFCIHLPQAQAASLLPQRA